MASIFRVKARTGIWFLLFIAGSLRAQEKSASKPATDYAKLAVIAGRWLVEGELKPSGPRAGGKLEIHEDCDWFEGGFAVVCQINSTGPFGSSKGISIHTYDPGLQAYSYYAITSAGTAELASGTNVDETWTWSGNLIVQGHVTKTRLTIQRISADQENVKLEAAVGNSGYVEVMEGVRKKVQ